MTYGAACTAFMTMLTSGCGVIFESARRLAMSYPALTVQA